MGMYPSADLNYGIDLGLEEEVERPDWFTEELEEEHGGMEEASAHLLKNAGVSGVHVDSYGNFASGFVGHFLYTRRIHAVAYNAESAEGCHPLPPDAPDVDALSAAWRVLYGEQEMPKPGWCLLVSYG